MVANARQTTSSAARNPAREAARPQSGWAEVAVRPATTAQLTGLKSDTVRIHDGIRFAARNVVDRNVSGSTMNCTAPISASSWRMISPKPFDSAPNVAPSSAETTNSAATPPTPPGNEAPTIRASATMITRLDHHHDRLLEDPPGDQRLAADRRDQEARGDAAVEVLDQRHPAPGRVEHRGHHDHAGRQERDVGVAVEAGDLDHPLEQRAEQQQPDHRLDQRDRHEPGLAPQLAQVAQGHVQGVPDQRHRVRLRLLGLGRVERAARVLEVDVVERRSSHPHRGHGHAVGLERLEHQRHGAAAVVGPGAQDAAVDASRRGPPPARRAPGRRRRCTRPRDRRGWRRRAARA